jgi:hypothetical protein
MPKQSHLELWGLPLSHARCAATTRSYTAKRNTKSTITCEAPDFGSLYERTT